MERMSESRLGSICALLALAAAAIAGCSGGDLLTASSISVTSSMPATSTTSEWSTVSRAKISWQEEGQYFVADYRGLSVELAAEQMIARLDSWYMFPAP
jgi:hypothetical protein